jgi:AraC-like DNA-binding protein
MVNLSKKPYLPINGLLFSYSYSNIPPHDYHVHDTYEVFYLMQGGSEYFVKDQLFSVIPGNLVLIPKGYIHQNRYITEQYERIVINFTEHWIDSDNLGYMEDISSRYIWSPTDSLVKDTIDGIRREWANLRRNEADTAALKMMRYYVNMLIVHLARNKAAFTTKNAKITHPCVDKVIRFINQNYHLPITLDTVAKELNLTAGYLSSLFVKNTGIRFKDYLWNIRLTRAKHLLEHTHKSVQEIACECGFNDSNYFSTAFKHCVGSSPLNYRKTLLTKQ